MRCRPEATCQEADDYVDRDRRTNDALEESCAARPLEEADDPV